VDWLKDSVNAMVHEAVKHACSSPRHIGMHLPNTTAEVTRPSSDETVMRVLPDDGTSKPRYFVVRITESK
jgi:hypothetical protein